MTTISPEVLAAANDKSRRLKELLIAPEILILPGAFNVLSALLYQHLGFPAIQGSSAGFANAMGYEDLAIGRDKTVEASRLVAAAVTVPVNADGEEGFGGPDDVRETVRAFVAAGLAGMNMEDGSKTAPGGLVSVEEQLEKIAAFMEERRSLGSEFLLNARVDTFVALHDDPAKALAEGVGAGRPTRAPARTPSSSSESRTARRSGRSSRRCRRRSASSPVPAYQARGSWRSSAWRGLATAACFCAWPSAPSSAPPSKSWNRRRMRRCRTRSAARRCAKSWPAA